MPVCFIDRLIQYIQILPFKWSNSEDKKKLVDIVGLFMKSIFKPVINQLLGVKQVYALEM